MGTIITKDGISIDNLTFDKTRLTGLSDSLEDGDYTDGQLIETAKIVTRIQSLESQITNTRQDPESPIDPNAVNLTIQQIRNALGTMAVQNRDAVDIRGGTIAGVTLENVDLQIKRDLTFAAETLKLFDNTSSLRTRDVMIYDTSEDHDFGAWTDRTSQASWHTDARGPFPRVAALVAHDNGLRIMNASVTGFTPWMTLTTAATSGFLGASIKPKALHMKNGVLALGSGTGLLIFDFLEDKVYRFSPVKSVFAGTIGSVVNGDAGTPKTVSGVTLGQASVNSVEVFAAEDAPLHPTTGAPLSSILVGNETHVQIIGPDRTITEVQPSRASHQVHSAARSDRGDLYTLRMSSGNALEVIRANNFAGSAASLDYASGLRPQFVPNATRAYWDVQATASGAVFGPSTRNEMVFIQDPGKGGVLDGMGIGISNAYISGWLPAGTFLATLNGTAAPSDTSGFNLALGVTGTVARAAVSSGADLQHYGPFSSANYYSRTNLGASVSLGSGDFAIMTWIRTSGSSAVETVLTYGQRNGANTAWTGAYLDLAVAANGIPRLVSRTAAGVVRNLTASVAINDGAAHLLILRRTGNVLSLSVDGDEETLDMDDADVYTNANGDLTLGRHPSTTSAALASGQLSLFRMSTRTVTNAQIGQIYRSEKRLFQPDAKCFFDGSIRQIRHDRLSGRTMLSTTQGAFVYQGLHVIDTYNATHDDLTSGSLRSAYANRNHVLLGTNGETVAIRGTDTLAAALRRLLSVFSAKEEEFRRKILQIQETLVADIQGNVLGETQIRSLMENYLKKGSNITFVDDPAAETRTIHGPSVESVGSTNIITTTYKPATNKYELSVNATNLETRLRNSFGSLITGDSSSGIRVELDRNTNKHVVKTFGLEAGSTGNILISALGANTPNTYTISGPDITVGSVGSSYLKRSYDANRNEISLSGAGVIGTRLKVAHRSSDNTWLLTAPSIGPATDGYLKANYDSSLNQYQLKGPQVSSHDDALLVSLVGQNAAFSAAASAYRWRITGPTFASSDGTIIITKDVDATANKNNIDLKAGVAMDFGFRAGYSPLSGDAVSLVRGQVGTVLVPRNGTIQDVFMRLQEAPTGIASNKVVIDIKKNGASIFANESSRLMTTGTATVKVSTQSSASIPKASGQLNAGDHIAVEVMQTGSTVRGGGLDVIILVTSR